MPYKLERVSGGRYSVTSPHGVKAKGTTKAKAEAQIRLLQAEEHDPGFEPRKSKRGKIKSRKSKGKRGR